MNKCHYSGHSERDLRNIYPRSTCIISTIISSMSNKNIEWFFLYLPIEGLMMEEEQRGKYLQKNEEWRKSKERKKEIELSKQYLFLFSSEK